MKKILITGTNGFIGSALYLQLAQQKSFFLLKTTRLNIETPDLFIDLSSAFNVKSEQLVLIQ